MRAVLLLLLTLSSAVAVAAQEQGPPGVVVIKHSWSKERVGWERDPFGGPIGYADQLKIRARDEKRIEDAKRGGNTAEAERARRDAQTDAAILERTRRQGETPPRYAFLYKMSLMNGGAKTVREVDWDYVFFDASTNEELGRRQFTSEAKVSPGKSKELSFMISSPPTQRISARSLVKNERDGLGERVVIVRVLYDDGTEWRRP